MTLLDSSFVLAEDHDGVCVARVRCDRITEREAAILAEELAQAAAQTNWKVAIDLTTVVFLASAGIGVFVTINRKATADGGKMALFGLAPEILEVLKITRLHKLFALAKTEDGAVKAVR